MKTLKFLYGIAAYILFLGTFLYAIAFVEDILVPKTINGPEATAPAYAWMINLLLLGSFAIQHSVMARPGFKEWWTRFVSKDIERSTFVLLTCVCLVALYVFWQPMPTVVWSVESPLLAAFIVGFSFVGWAIVLLSTFLINHFDLFGLRQVWLQFTGKPYTTLKFAKKSLYKYVRHPLMLGFLIAFWASPQMTVGHLLFALATTGYILIALQLEERDLVRAHGDHYRTYQKEVPMLVPIKRTTAGK